MLEGPAGADSLPYAGEDFNVRQSLELSIREKLVGSVSRAVGFSLGSTPINPSSGTIENNQYLRTSGEISPTEFLPDHALVSPQKPVSAGSWFLVLGPLAVLVVGIVKQIRRYPCTKNSAYYLIMKSMIGCWLVDTIAPTFTLFLFVAVHWPIGIEEISTFSNVVGLPVPQIILPGAWGIGQELIVEPLPVHSHPIRRTVVIGVFLFVFTHLGGSGNDWGARKWLAGNWMSHLVAGQFQLDVTYRNAPRSGARRVQVSSLDASEGGLG
jgi:hypothetical protein